MYIGAIVLGMIFGTGAAVISLGVGYSFWIALVIYSAVGCAVVLAAVMFALVLPTVRSTQYSARNHSTSGLTFDRH